MKKKIWWLLNVVWLVIFAGGALFITMRGVDAAGITQTPELKMISSIIWGILFIFIVLVQLILFFAVVRKNTNRSERL
ncbi:DUF3923 family protein [Bacillus sp. Bva_UNVM-123]|uniref:DUF3923 family protein n=1 Tax=Bacillus sp. Bva_UNVM-123 TaxID=2829798 RepID=UPI00391F6D49